MYSLLQSLIFYYVLKVKAFFRFIYKKEAAATTAKAPNRAWTLFKVELDSAPTISAVVAAGDGPAAFLVPAAAFAVHVDGLVAAPTVNVGVAGAHHATRESVAEVQVGTSVQPAPATAVHLTQAPALTK